MLTILPVQQQIAYRTFSNKQVNITEKVATSICFKNYKWKPQLS